MANIPVHKTQCVFDTNGKGMWSQTKKKVKVTGIDVYSDMWWNGPASMRVYFDPKTWNVERHGLIYTDPGFLKDLRDALKEAGYNHTGTIEYSEQGLQGEYYVHLDVSQRFMENF